MTVEGAGVLMKEEIILPTVGKSLPVPNLLNATNILATLGSFLFWVDFYLLALILNPKRSCEWNCRIVTSVHGGISAVLSLLVCFYFGPWPFSHIAQPCNDMHLAIVLFSFGYFIFDFSWCLWSQTESAVMLAHHVVSISGFVLVLCTGMYGAEIVATLGGSEVTNPLLQGRWFLRKTGGYKGRVEVVLDWCFMVLFGGVRLGLGGPLTYLFQTNPNVIIPAKIGSAAMFGISVVFFVQLVNFVFRKYILKKHRKNE